jgi:bifunctional non-homologous end joining protein LigD
MFWRVSRPARSRRAPPAQFIVPCQPILSDRAPSGAGWIHELKFDGYRLVARKNGSQVRLWSRNATDFTEHFRSIADAVAALPVETATIDGEAVIFHPDGHSDFTALRSKIRSETAVLVAFDLLEVAGADIRRHPLETVATSS